MQLGARLTLISACSRLSRYAEADEQIALAEEQARACGDRRSEAELLVHRGNLAYFRGSFALALELQQRAQAGFHELGLHDREVALLTTLGNTLACLAEYHQGRRDIEQGGGVGRRRGD